MRLLLILGVCALIGITISTLIDKDFKDTEVSLVKMQLYKERLRVDSLKTQIHNLNQKHMCSSFESGTGQDPLKDGCVLFHNKLMEILNLDTVTPLADSQFIQL